MNRRTFIGSLIAIATLGRLPKSKAVPPTTLPAGWCRNPTLDRTLHATHSGKLDRETSELIRRAMASRHSHSLYIAAPEPHLDRMALTLNGIPVMLHDRLGS